MIHTYDDGLQRLLLVVSGAACCLLLAGCDMLNVDNPLVDSRPKQVVEGPRRYPVLNPGATPGAPAPHMVEIQPIVPNQPPLSAAPKEAGNKAPTPYDQYDDKGNEIGGRNYVKDWLGEKKEDEVAKPQAMTYRNIRKPFPGNPIFTKETTAIAPIAPAPSATIVPIMPPASRPVPMAESTPLAKKIPTASSDAIFLPLLESPGDDENGVIIPQEENHSAAPAQQTTLVQSTLPPLQTKPLAANTLNVPKEDLHLSSVPPVPKQYDMVKATKDQQLQELQSDQDIAQEQKKSLAAEPTALPATNTAPSEETVVTEPMSEIATVLLPAHSWHHVSLNKAGQ